MRRVTLRLPNKLNERLLVAARRSGKTPARFVREMLETRLADLDPLPEIKASLHDFTRDLCGSISGGPRDLAQNKKHLDGYGSRAMRR
jgi:hypothetical protein